ncbi:MAG: membrane protein insertion efficiency factor YidD [Cohaesibacteraceae bacterium]|nr:membrane protein insertion efficiency factor YidD [Cohaesibacteraceae bacterium]MBL4875928.1 membrane protein insertion efficiency factor YidD [Cohaesibacteraceae bacterium]
MRWLILRLIRIYQIVVSPFLGQSCRYAPTCSHYGEIAIMRFGAWAGGWMTLARFMRCNPFGASGFDPVPVNLPMGSSWYTPWRYGQWSGKHIDPDTRLDI